MQMTCCRPTTEGLNSIIATGRWVVGLLSAEIFGYTQPPDSSNTPTTWACLPAHQHHPRRRRGRRRGASPGPIDDELQRFNVPAWFLDGAIRQLPRHDGLPGCARAPVYDQAFAQLPAR